ncbi:MAG: lysophospholipid acyltransferase family protein [Planctomycetota bacterium]
MARRFQHGFYRFCRALATVAAKALGHLCHYNAPDLRALECGLLVASNHQSFWDPVLIGTGVKRPLHFLARRTLFEAPGFGRMIRGLNAHPVRRGAVDSEALRTVLRLLRRGEPLVMFPEGTRSHDGELGEFKSGVAGIAARCDVPILPVCVEGAWQNWPRHRSLPRPAAMAVAYGQMIRPRGEAPKELTRRLRCEIGELQRFLRRRLYPAGRNAEGNEIRSVPEARTRRTNGRRL